MFVALIASLAPVSVRAFWPFSSAQADSPEDPILTDTTVAYLDPAINSDPNPSKGSPDLAMSADSALLAATGADGSLPVSDAPSAGGDATIQSYTVKDGDSISEIADSFGVSVNTILWANNLTAKSIIKPGMTLIVLPVSGVQYTVKKGGTLSDVAKIFNADIDEIATINGIDPDATLAAGTELIIPGGKLTPTASGTTKSSGAKSPAVPAGLSSGGGASLSGFWTNPLPGGIMTQGIHDNNAVDIGAHAGTPIYAAASGKVIFVSTNGSYNHGWGNDVIINHANGAQTLYAHMSRVAATVGEEVKAGELIGYVGMTGMATGNHLHFEVHGARNPFAGCALRKACSI